MKSSSYLLDFPISSEGTDWILRFGEEFLGWNSLEEHIMWSITKKNFENLKIQEELSTTNK